MSILFTNHDRFLVLLHILLLFIAIVPSPSVLAFDDCTDNHAPDQPTNPFPVPSSTDVSRQVILSWDCVDSDNDELVYDVYFDSQLPMKRQTTKQNNTFFDPGLLCYNTRYYWMIVAYDPCDRLSLSRVWTFSTIQNPTPHPPSITLIEPQPNAQNVSLPVTLSVMVSDEDNDPLTVTFYDESNMVLESLVSEPGKTVSWIWDDLGYNTTYTW
ncbi:MAG: hypothetical protein QCI00_08185, partial [Candidatus Thermoplasmatota archaeon]|nr:hypothetical protein [Candidatus Thermoplasmatota archaeon]